MWIRLVLVVIIAAVVHHIFTFISVLGLEKTVYNHRPGDCQFVRGIEHGAEDLELLSDGIVIISQGYLTYKDRVKGAPRGHLYAYDINDHAIGATELKITGDYDVDNLHPHGITAFEDKKTGKTFLFVISHPVGFEVVDIFEFHRSSMSLSFIKSKRDPLMTSVNNLVAIGPEEFYITNEAYSLHPTMRLLEDLLFMRMGSVLFCDVTGCKKVSESLNLPNGIDLSRDGRYLYVAQTFGKKLLVYERDPSDNSLKGNQAVHTIDLGTSPDNVYVDNAGDIWLAGLPVVHKALSYLDAKEGLVPAQVLRVRIAGFSDVEMSEVYSEDGRNVTLSTSAVHHDGVLLIGTLYERMMRCQIEAL